MKLKLINFNLLVYEGLNFIFLKYLNILLIKIKYGIIKIYLPKYYFYNTINNNLYFIFLNKFYFNYIVKQLYLYLKIYLKFFFFRLKLKGLGYRIKKIEKNIYRFFMAYNHFFYLYLPINVYIWNKKRNFLVISVDNIKLNNLFFQLLLLKKMDFFERTNAFIIPKRILFIKK